ncbi:hypothetical protein GGR53DRAFT_462759 [Hypoxylon sp. FL1150]|nr:hypothetical protein GGR53DRAFT_462759 [Hypoxylon sp. FL1150]
MADTVTSEEKDSFFTASMERYSEYFNMGENPPGPIDPAVYLHMSTEMCLHHLKSRLRVLENSLYNDTVLERKKRKEKGLEGRRNAFNNIYNHGFSIEMDAVWLALGIQDFDRKNATFHKVKNVSKICFEISYGITVEEAFILFGLATERDDNDNRTEVNKLCSHAIKVINDYSKHRVERSTQSMLRASRKKPATREDYVGHGGAKCDEAYNVLLQTTFWMAWLWMNDGEVPETARNQWKTSLANLTAQVKASTFPPSVPEWSFENLGILYVDFVNKAGVVDQVVDEPTFMIDITELPLWNDADLPGMDRQPLNHTNTPFTWGAAPEKLPRRRRDEAKPPPPPAPGGTGGTGSGGNGGTGSGGNGGSSKVAQAVRRADGSSEEDDGEPKRWGNTAGQPIRRGPAVAKSHPRRRAAALFGTPVILPSKRKGPTRSTKSAPTTPRLKKPRFVQRAKGAGAGQAISETSW